MVNEDIITILRNGIERGESLEVCKRIAINSGYNPREVEEASHFISRGTMTNLKQQNPLDLIMPNKKSFNFFRRKPKESFDMNKKENPPMPINQNKPMNKGYEEQYKGMENKNPKILIQSNNQIELNKPKKKGFTKEIILFILLLILVGLLILTVVFRNRILEFFSAY